MSTRRPRRARHRDTAALYVLGGVGVMILFALHPLLVSLLALLATVSAALIRRGRRSFQRRPPARPAPSAPPPPRQAPGDARARRNGWLPPARPALLMGITAECADGDCAICPGGDCACPCGHDARVIVAMCDARRAAADSEEVPF